MSRYLVTGVAGFIGSTVAQALVDQGHEVDGVDNLSDGELENIPEGVRFFEADIRDVMQMYKLCLKKHYILHFAAKASVPFSVRYPLMTHDINVNGTLNLLNAAREAGAYRFIYSASSSAYGNLSVPASEGMSPNPVSPYAVQKLTGEYYVKSFCKTYGMEAVCLRYFNVFGARQSATSPYSGVIAQFISKMLEVQTPFIRGDGSSSRDFTYVDDVVQAILLACSAPPSIADGRVFNIGTGNSITILELYTTLAGIIGFERSPEFVEPSVGDIQFSQADIRRAVQELGYSPETDLVSGLEKTVRWYRDAVERGEISR